MLLCLLQGVENAVSSFLSTLKHVAASWTDAGGIELWSFRSGSIFFVSPTYQLRYGII